MNMIHCHRDPQRSDILLTPKQAKQAKIWTTPYKVMIEDQLGC